MTVKIKIFLAILALTALFSVFLFFGSITKNAANKVLSTVKSAISFAIDPDSDHDGLNDKDESYWNTDFQNPDTDGDGYLDGEEVASGHDPRIAGPDDLLDLGNLTKITAGLVLSGLYEGSLKPDSPNYAQSLTDLTSNILDNASQDLTKKISALELKIIDSTKDNQEKYLEDINNLGRKFALASLEELAQIQSELDLIGEYGFKSPEVKSYFTNQTKIFDEFVNTGLLINVPNNWIDEHIYVLEIIDKTKEENSAIADGESDPIKAVVALNSFGDRFIEINAMINHFKSKAEEEKLNNSYLFNQK